MLMLEKKAVAGACDGYESLMLHYGYTLAIMISSFIYIYMCVHVCVCIYIDIVTSGLPFMHGPLQLFILLVPIIDICLLNMSWNALTLLIVT